MLVNSSLVWGFFMGFVDKNQNITRPDLRKRHLCFQYDTITQRMILQDTYYWLFWIKPWRQTQRFRDDLYCVIKAYFSDPDLLNSFPVGHAALCTAEEQRCHLSSPSIALDAWMCVCESIHLSMFGFCRGRGVKGCGGGGGGGGVGGHNVSIGRVHRRAPGIQPIKKDCLSLYAVKQLYRQLFPGCACVCVCLHEFLSIYPGEDQCVYRTLGSKHIFGWPSTYRRHAAQPSSYVQMM